MQSKLFLTLLVGAVCISCSKQTLKCDDKEVVKTAAEIAKEQYETDILPTLKNIRTKGQDEKLKSCECEAEISVMGEQYDVVYTAEHTTDGGIYVKLLSF